MNNSIVITAVVSALVTWVFMYIDSRLFDTPKTKLSYVKGMSFVAAVGATIVYFMGSPAMPQVGGGGSTGLVGSNIGQGTALVQGINQEMFTGMPSF